MNNTWLTEGVTSQNYAEKMRLLPEWQPCSFAGCRLVVIRNKVFDNWKLYFYY